MTVLGVVGRAGCVLGLALTVLGAAACGDSSNQSGSGGSGPVTFPPGSFAGSGTAGGGGEPPVMMVLDDGVDCTLDKCENGVCTHTPRHFACGSRFEYCDPGRGCAQGPDLCIYDYQCGQSYECLAVTCDLLTQRCLYASTDADGDGAAPVACGGVDCNDKDAKARTVSDEVCDGLDNDCDGVVDPPKASGCEAPLSCVDAKCQCAAPSAVCGSPSACVDLTSDAKNCGACGVICTPGTACTDGKCDCAAGQDHCGDLCFNLQSDTENCGKCGVSCGSAECKKGACACAVNQTDCDAGAGFDCHALATDAANCGSCGKQCLSASACVASQCDTEVEQVRLYGGADAGAFSSPLVADTSGNVYAALYATGEHRALPDGQTSLWNSDYALVKLDSDANFVWSVATSWRIADMATSGNDIWVALVGNTALKLGEKTFDLAADRAGLGLVVKLSGANGAILDTQRFDFAEGPSSAKLLVGADGVWCAFEGGAKVDYLGSSSTAVDAANTSPLFRIGTSTPRWLPGLVTSMVLDADTILLADSAPATGPFSVGGDTFTCTLRFGCSAIARYTKDLAHVASFALPADQVSAALPLDGKVLLVNTGGGYFQLYDAVGKLLSSQPAFPYLGLGIHQNGTKVASYGATNQVASELPGRSFAKNQSFFVVIDAISGTIENGFSMASDFSNGMLTSIDGYALDPATNTVLVSYLFDGAFTLGGKSYGQAGTRGVAFIKLKLNQP